MADFIIDDADSGRLFVYKFQISEWKRRYGKRLVGQQPWPDLTKVRLNRCCTKCGSKDDITRHHKGHEYLFATLRPDDYAARYIAFLDEDCVDLCEDCHIEIHCLYTMILYGAVNRQDQHHRLTFNECEDLRHALIELYEWWVEKG